MKEMVEKLKLIPIIISFYHPQSNRWVDRLHHTIHNILAKSVVDNEWSWDMDFNQTLAGIRFNKNKTTKFSPFKLAYNRDVVLPIDNILQPRQIYYGDEYHQITFQE